MELDCLWTLIIDRFAKHNEFSVALVVSVEMLLQLYIYHSLSVPELETVSIPSTNARKDRNSLSPFVRSVGFSLIVCVHFQCQNLAEICNLSLKVATW